MVTTANILAILGVVIVYTGWSLLQEDKDVLRRILLLVGSVGLFLLCIVYDWISVIRSKVKDLEKVNWSRLRELRASQRQFAEVQQELREENEDTN